uniref:Uncharacterized protein n=1 Tax=Anguilla anguilla TaxID=7936 RepID=A0A0E9RAD3_ANGAN
MIQNPNTWVDATLPLRTNLAARKRVTSHLTVMRWELGAGWGGV